MNGAKVIEIPCKNGERVYEVINFITKIPTLVVLTVLVITIVLIYKYLKSSRDGNKQPLRRWVQQEYLPKMLFAIYLVVLAKITIIPGSAFFSAGPYVFTQDTLVIYFGIGLSTMNLLPFKSVLDAFDHGFFYGLYHNVGNIAMLVPFGYMLRAIYKKVNANRIIVYAIVLSLFIEFVQFFEARSVDIDDVILNTIGAALGVILYELIVGKKAILKKRTL